VPPSPAASRRLAAALRRSWLHAFSWTSSAPCLQVGRGALPLSTFRPMTSGTDQVPRARQQAARLVAMALNRTSRSASDSQAAGPVPGRSYSALQPSRGAGGQQAPPPFAARFGKDIQSNRCKAPLLLSLWNRSALAHQPCWRCPVARGPGAAIGLGLWRLHQQAGCYLRQGRPRAWSPRATSDAPFQFIPRTSLPICSGSPRSKLAARSLPQPEQFAGGECLGAGSAGGRRCAGTTAARQPEAHQPGLHSAG